MNDKVPCSSTKLIRGGTAYSSSPFELNLQLHGQVSNPYSFGIKQNYKSSTITKVSIPPYTEKSWTTPGTYTWAVPAGVTRIRVAVCGGGGGGTRNRSRLDRCTNGGTSSISNSNNVLLSATGGGRISGEDNSLEGYYTYYNGTGGSPNPKNDGTGWNINFSKQSGNYGRGSKVNTLFDFSPNYNYGGSGGYDTKYFSVNSNSKLTIVVGSKGSNYDNNGLSVDSNPGFVLIAYGEGIE